jgi:hypothetical protein
VSTSPPAEHTDPTERRPAANGHRSGSANPSDHGATIRLSSLAANPLSALLALALALPLAVYAATGAFARYVADDYCWAGLLRTEGFVDAQVAWYTTYSPRYAFTFLVNLVELAGPPIVPLLPTIAIVTAVLTATWALAQFALSRLIALLLGLIAVLATLQTAPDLGQSLYWQTGMLTYLLPLVLATLVIGWTARADRLSDSSFLSAGLLTVVTFIAGGLSETYLIPQNVALTLAALACAVLARGRRRRILLTYLLAALAGGVLALLAIVVAPATAYRVGGSPADLWLATSASIATAAYQVLRLLRYFAPTVLLVLLAPGVLAAAGIGRRDSVLGDGAGARALTSSARAASSARATSFERATAEGPPPHGILARQDLQRFAAVTLCVAVTLPFCYFPSFYAQNGNPPARSLIVPGAILIAYTLFVGWTIAPFVQRALTSLPARAPVAAMAVLALVPLGIAASSFPERAQAAQYAAQWDAEDQQIRLARDAGESDLTVPPLPPFLGEDFVGADRRDWFNMCVARYYGVNTIASSDAIAPATR